MKHAFERYKEWIITFASIEVLLIFLYSFTKLESNIYLGITAALITGFISIINYYQNGDKLFKELFVEFNTRYDKCNNILQSIKIDTELTEELKPEIIDYLNLCAEEFMWVRKGRIPEEIWINWKSGIDQYLKIPAIKKVYEEERSLFGNSYYGFFKEMDKN